jgi:hypothetical protein
LGSAHRLRSRPLSRLTIRNKGAHASGRTVPDDARTIGACGYALEGTEKWTARTIRTLVSPFSPEKELSKGFYSGTPTGELPNLIEYQVFSSPTQRVEGKSRPQRPDRPSASEINRSQPDNPARAIVRDLARSSVILSGRTIPTGFRCGDLTRAGPRAGSNLMGDRMGNDSNVVVIMSEISALAAF